MSVLVAVVALVGVGLPLAFALTRDLAVAAVLAPLVTGVQCSVAAVAMVVVGGPFAVWVAGTTVVAWAIAVPLLRRGRRRRPLPTLTLGDLAVMYVPLLLPALLVIRYPVNWDPRSIWWFHATWIDAGSGPFRDALGNPALVYSHPDYPPLAPATIAGAWTVTGGTGLWVAQVVSTVLTLSALAMLAYTVRHLVPTVRPMVARLVALGVALSLWSLADYGVAGGYVDHLWSAALAAAVVLLFIGGTVVAPGGRSGDEAPGGELALAVVLMVVAAVTKNEGLVAVAMVAVLFTIRARHQLRRAAWVWVPVAAGMAWSVIGRSFGAASDLASSPRITQLIEGDLAPLERVGPTVSSLRDYVGWALLGALVVSLIGVAALRRRRRELGLVSVIWPWLVVAGFAVVLIATYVISPYDLGWHLITSADRVGVLLVLVCLSIVASWVLVALAPSGGRRPAGGAGRPLDRRRRAVRGRSRRVGSLARWPSAS